MEEWREGVEDGRRRGCGGRGEGRMRKEEEEGEEGE